MDPFVDCMLEAPTKMLVKFPFLSTDGTYTGIGAEKNMREIHAQLTCTPQVTLCISKSII